MRRIHDQQAAEKAAKDEKMVEALFLHFTTDLTFHYLSYISLLILHFTTDYTLYDCVCDK